MDLKQYYENIRQVWDSIREDFPVIVSLDTPDGGKAGTMTEVTRGVAARMVAERRARVATAEEHAEYLQEKQERKRLADELEAASRFQVRVVTGHELHALKKQPERSQ